MTRWNDENHFLYGQIVLDLARFILQVGHARHRRAQAGEQLVHFEGHVVRHGDTAPESRGMFNVEDSPSAGSP